MNGFVEIYYPAPPVYPPSFLNNQVLEVQGNNNTGKSLPLPKEPYDNSHLLQLFYGVMWHGERYDIILDQTPELANAGWTTELLEDQFHYYRTTHGVTDYFVHNSKVNDKRRYKLQLVQDHGLVRGLSYADPLELSSGDEGESYADI